MFGKDLIDQGLVKDIKQLECFGLLALCLRTTDDALD
jgi:hypothetical protein